MVNQDWRREYELVFSGPEERVEISSVNKKNPLDIQFAINIEGKVMPQSVMDLTVRGLSESNVAKLTGNGIRVFLSVGYSGQPLKTVYTGYVVFTDTVTTAGKSETKFKCKSSRIDSKPMNFTFPKGTTHAGRMILMLQEGRKLIPDLNIDTAIVEMATLAAEEPDKAQLAKKGLPNKTLLNDEVVGSHTCCGTILEELRTYAKTFWIKLVIANDEVHFVREGGTVNSTNKIPAILGDNLLSPPRRSMDNTEGAVGTTDAKFFWNMHMMMTPQILINSTVVSDVSRGTEGQIDPIPIEIKVIKITHTGQYYGNSWYTEVVGTWEQDIIKNAPNQSIAEETLNPKPGPTFSGAGATGSF
ncbi:MAG: hypothetical protein HRU21_10595 [Pseudomonadales bacterium]|nr:hypothetical protein [Pseudomonadales bacterium]